MPLLAIVADDLTGAADTAAAFAAVGFATVIPLSGEERPAADVVVLSTQSRDVDPAAAAHAVTTAVAALCAGPQNAAPRWLYKKIDSALRGHPREELLAALTAAGETRTLVAPAFPAQGRTTVGGHQLIDGLPLAASRFGGDTATSDLRALFANEQGLPVRLLELETIRTRPGILSRLLDDPSAGITIADAETDADLLLLARAASQSSLKVLCGTAGLARQLARVLPPATATIAPHTVRRTGPVLIVAGSRHAATSRQIAALARAGIPVVSPTQAIIDDPDASIAPTVAEVATHLRTGKTAVLTTAGLDPCPRGEAAVAARLAQMTAAATARHHIGALVLTGGDVAAAVCAELAASSLWLRGEVSPGLPWGALAGGALPGLPVATKAGSFGGDDALLKCVDYLVRDPD